MEPTKQSISSGPIVGIGFVGAVIGGGFIGGLIGLLRHTAELTHGQGINPMFWASEAGHSRQAQIEIEVCLSIIIGLILGGVLGAVSRALAVKK